MLCLYLLPLVCLLNHSTNEPDTESDPNPYTYCYTIQWQTSTISRHTMPFFQESEENKVRRLLAEKKRIKRPMPQQDFGRKKTQLSERDFIIRMLYKQSN